MASGSQVWSGNCADLPITAISRAAAAATSAVRPISPAIAISLIWAMSKLRSAAKNRIEMPTSRPMSPVRVVRNALRAAFEFGFSSHQWPMSMNEHRPISSQPNSAPSVVEAVTSTNMPVVNRLSAAKKCV
jgi:hypothetical protein